MKKRLVSFLLVFLLTLTAAGTGAGGTILSFAEITASAADKKSSVTITNETFLPYKNVISGFSTGKGIPYLYNFNTVLSTGFDSGGKLIDIEANYGITAYLKDRKINVKAYDYSKKPAAIERSCIQNLDKGNGKITNLNLDYSYKSIDTSKYKNGLYGIAIWFKGTKKPAVLYFYINSGKTWLCNVRTMTDDLAKGYQTERTSLAKVIKNGKVTPNNSLDTDGIYYPFYPFPDGTEGSKWRCDTQLWIDLSNTLVEKDWTKEHKLFVFYEWINENIAYDNYEAKTLDMSRARYYGDYSGKYSVYNLRAGDCWDYSHILLLMCRAHDIPAITVGSKKLNHLWNAVYINNRWIEIDMTTANKYDVNTVDTTKRTKASICDVYFPFGPSSRCPHTVNDAPIDKKANQSLQTGYSVG